tara:strand:- start:946 stop:1152 length:207 start_codon:yes stop_codon:yes gene_type:complete
MTTSNVSPMRKTIPCPECSKPSDRESHPFCSERCRNLDLGRWLNGSYAIPVSESEENQDPDDDENHRF